MTSQPAGGNCARTTLAALLCCLPMALLLPAAARAQAPAAAAEAAWDSERVDSEMKRAAQLYSARDFAGASQIYWEVSQNAPADQAAWALELYAVCQEKQGQREQAVATYDLWLQRYAGSEGEVRVQQRRTALVTATAAPRASGRRAENRDERQLYGSASLMYRGLRREIEDGESDTPMSSLSGDADVYLRASTGGFLWRGRASGGYLADGADDGDSQGRVRNLYVGVQHADSGAELVLGRQRTSDNGIYGYLDGVEISYPVLDNLTLRLLGGGLVGSSQDAPSSDHKVYSLAAEYELVDPRIKFTVYGMEQTFEGVTERRALGGEFSWFNERSYYLLIADYDIEFQEANNLMFNGNWTFGTATNVALSLGYQRSPFLSASNALIGQYELDLDQVLERLGPNQDIYDAALERTALSRYASLVINQPLGEGLRMIGEIFHYELSELPQYDPAFEAPDSDANTTYGLQFINEKTLFDNDVLSIGARYTVGDFADSSVLYLDEKLRFGNGVDLTLRLTAAQRSPEGGDRDSFNIRPGLRLDWYLSRDLLLDFEAGYEYMQQDFEVMDFKVHQGYVLMGVHQRF
ncbi:hypothetical protein E4634_06010 [Mangrovimicrobium sediminis]|uniref:Tetratricopeptide repeat protein n=1 Tax=Mangrovimicrobium sediminis TaxID=2562682 RepID=A0A4Z0M525_9GAMM|nr:hypothetical protein [Haliea sp. SAOS-164]TGD74752.1 hypothetical protein E4634_06010 [Haliea sp. SAOS-164]